MSIILKGINLPKRGTIKLEIEPNGMVWAEGKDWQSYTESAIQLPKRHGRLIDADELKEKRETMCWKDEHYMTHESDFIDSRHIDNAPTILEADKR